MWKDLKVFLLLVLCLLLVTVDDVQSGPFFQTRTYERPAESSTYSFKPSITSVRFPEGGRLEEVLATAQRNSYATPETTPDWMDWLLNDMNLKQFLGRTSTQPPEPSTRKPIDYQRNQAGPKKTDTWQQSTATAAGTGCLGPLQVCRPGVSSDQFELLMHKVDHVLNQCEDCITKPGQQRSKAPSTSSSPADGNEKPSPTSTQAKEWVDMKLGHGNKAQQQSNRQKVYASGSESVQTKAKPKTTTTSKRPSTTPKPKKTTTVKTTTSKPTTTAESIFGPEGFKEISNSKKGYLMCPCTHSPNDSCKGGTEEVLPVTCLLYKHKKLDNGHLFECACGQPGQGVVTLLPTSSTSQGTIDNSTTSVSSSTATPPVTTTTPTVTTAALPPTTTTALPSPSTNTTAATTTKEMATTTTSPPPANTTTSNPVTTTTSKPTTTTAVITSTTPAPSPIPAQPSPAPKPPSIEPSGGGIPYPSTEGIGETGGDPGLMPAPGPPTADLGQIDAQNQSQQGQSGALQQQNQAGFDPQQGYYPSQGVPMPDGQVGTTFGQVAPYGGQPGIDNGLQQEQPAAAFQQGQDPPNAGFSNGRLASQQQQQQQPGGLDLVTPNQLVTDAIKPQQFSWQQRGPPSAAGNPAAALPPSGYNSASGLHNVLPEQYHNPNFAPAAHNRRETDRHDSLPDYWQEEESNTNTPAPLPQIAPTTERSLTSEEIKRMVFSRMGRGK